jgi:hypothetical protein
MIYKPESFKKQFPKEFELMKALKDDCFMPYSYWRLFVAPFRSSRRHEQYYPSLSQYLNYYFLCKADAYTPFGNRDEQKSWIGLLNLLRAQRGLKPLTPHEEKLCLDSKRYVLYN